MLVELGSPSAPRAAVSSAGSTPSETAPIAVDPDLADDPTRGAPSPRPPPA
ncbi:hypothetical protein G5B46_06870 [Caulobacter sp. 602-2]|uniref:Uncharacterized protein n=1 Tax=Caulobacter sp. 602-2 TaxID=2710887 RepID=A0A6G4QVG6_9CAUL|nr:hypothetical protein [Caulobacter sp. 602-2]NGM49324.1 hypothetical protein [Caulobacter sp. 602-2]